MRFLLVEAAQVTVRILPEWRRQYSHLLMRPGRKTAKVGDGASTGHPFVLDVERKTRLPAAERFGSYAGQPGPGDGV